MQWAFPSISLGDAFVRCGHDLRKYRGGFVQPLDGLVVLLAGCKQRRKNQDSYYRQSHCSPVESSHLPGRVIGDGYRSCRISTKLHMGRRIFQSKGPVPSNESRQTGSLEPTTASSNGFSTPRVPCVGHQISRKNNRARTPYAGFAVASLTAAGFHPTTGRVHSKVSIPTEPRPSK